ESYWLPRAGFALARGWYRQIDMEDNSVLYSRHLNPVDYVRWLRSNAVAYVLLPATELDPVGGPQEARILRSGAPGLDAVFKSSNLTIYRLHSPPPLLAGPGVGRVDVFDHTTIAGTVSERGRYLLRVHYTPLWETSSSVCVTPGPNDMSWL